MPLKCFPIALPIAIVCYFLLGIASPNRNAVAQTWNGFQKDSFKVADRDAYLVVPNEVAQGSPWVWRARFPNYHPEIDIRLLEKGFHVAYIDVAGLFGSPQAVEIGDAFYAHLMSNQRLAPKPALEGVSRGGLFVYNWAVRNPDKVSCIYCDTPVCDIKSWPAGSGQGIGHQPSWKQCAAAYGMTTDEAMEFKGNPLDHAKEIALAKIPLMHIVSESDRVVPATENTYALQKRLQDHRFPMEIISIEQGTEESNGHHFEHPDPDRVTQFVVEHALEVPNRRKLLMESKRIVFLGDSITYSGEYIIFFEAWLQSLGNKEPPMVVNVGLPSETVSGLSEDGHAGGRFPRPDLDERLDRVLAELKPDLVFACYGINCGIYQPFDEERFNAYQNGIKNLQKKVSDAGSQLVLITPPSFDDQKARKDFSYNDVMGKYAQWLVSQRKNGQHVIDLHRGMNQQLAIRRNFAPKFTFQPDSVHPNQTGHWVIANEIISWFGEPKILTEYVPSDEVLIRELLSKKNYTAIRNRMQLLRDAYLTKTGHQRPGIRDGLPLDKALEKATSITEEIERIQSEKSVQDSRRTTLGW